MNTWYIHFQSIGNSFVIIVPIKNVRISDIEISNNNVSSNDLIGILLGLKIPREVCHNDFIESINNKNEVIFMQEIN